MDGQLWLIDFAQFQVRAVHVDQALLWHRHVE